MNTFLQYHTPSFLVNLVLAAQFFTRNLLSWIQPGLAYIKYYENESDIVLQFLMHDVEHIISMMSMVCFRGSS